jgi:hypothetical protein
MEKRLSLGDLEFSPEVVFRIIYQAEVLPGMRDSADAIAAGVNRELRERLEKAKQVYGFLHTDGYMLIDSHKGGSETHTARLVCIEEIK